MKKILIAATGTFLLPPIERLLETGMIECVGLITQPARPVGRDQHLQATPAARWAQQRHIRIFEYEKITPHLDEILAIGAEAMFVGDVGLIIPTKLLQAMPNQVINLHGSLLPKYRGATPIPQAILNGDTETGISWMAIRPSVDSGPVFHQEKLSLDPTDDTPSVYEKLSQLAASSVVEVMEKYWSGNLPLLEQDESLVTHTTKISREDGHAVWLNAEAEARKIRAYRPWPGLWTMIDGQRMKILEASAVAGSDQTTPAGTILSYQGGWAILCDHGVLVPTRVQREGKTPEDASVTLQAWPQLIGSRAV